MTSKDNLVQSRGHFAMRREELQFLFLFETFAAYLQLIMGKLYSLQPMHRRGDVALAAPSCRRVEISILLHFGIDGLLSAIKCEPQSPALLLAEAFRPSLLWLFLFSVTTSLILGPSLSVNVGPRVKTAWKRGTKRQKSREHGITFVYSSQ